VLPVLPVADPAWREGVEQVARRERQQLRRLEVRDAVERVVDLEGYPVSTEDIVREIAFEGLDYLLIDPDEAPGVWREIACRLQDAAKNGLIRNDGRGLITYGRRRLTQVYWTVVL